ncbi:hypothetical protein N9M32_03325 [Alphaproteobacteria bacterium]|jgi:hypothetical protein|nr:hypothetical protein [Pseudomonadota bacterium]MDA8695159.1 hypothetical protein [Alphaproteobacteria bacterium]MDA8710877.1 hypothetical protein [Alphaproteobacteria bacterium]
MNKRELIFLDQMIRKLASPYFVENDLYEYDRLQWATGVTKDDLYKAVKLIEKQYKKTKE